jgi:alpha-galactosidase
LSNFKEPSPIGPLKIRNLAWWRTPVIPAGALVIGNLQATDPGLEFGLKSLVGTMPLLLGDLRELTSEKKSLIRSWADWIKEMQHKYDYMTYRKDLSGFGEPKEGDWDGWQRINFQTQEGGIFGVFKQNAVEKTRTVALNDLKADASYTIRLAPHGEKILTTSGKVLMEEGFSVNIEEAYNGLIYEVSLEL